MQISTETATQTSFKLAYKLRVPWATLLMQSRYRFPFSSIRYCLSPWTIMIGSSVKKSDVGDLQHKKNFREIVTNTDVQYSDSHPTCSKRSFNTSLLLIFGVAWPFKCKAIFLVLVCFSGRNSCSAQQHRRKRCQLNQDQCGLDVRILYVKWASAGWWRNSLA